MKANCDSDLDGVDADPEPTEPDVPDASSDDDDLKSNTETLDWGDDGWTYFCFFGLFIILLRITGNEELQTLDGNCHVPLTIFAFDAMSF